MTFSEATNAHTIAYMLSWSPLRPIILADNRTADAPQVNGHDA